MNRDELGVALDALSRAKIGVVSSVLKAGVAPAMDKDTAIACLLDWASTPALEQKLDAAIQAQANPAVRSNAGADGAAPAEGGAANERTGMDDSGTGEQVPATTELCPRCLKEVERLAKGAAIKDFLSDLFPDGVGLFIRSEGGLEVLRVIYTALDQGITPPPRAKFIEFLAAVAPLCISAQLVRDTRRALQINPTTIDRKRLKGGVVALGPDVPNGADSIIRGAIFDQHCFWTWTQVDQDPRHRPYASSRLDAAGVPGTSTITGSHDLKRRIKETFGAMSFEAALAIMRERLLDGESLLVICNQEILGYVNEIAPHYRDETGVTHTLKDLAIFLHPCLKEPANIAHIYDRLCRIVDKL